MIPCRILLAWSATVVARARGLNILITNDDGFGTSNIRELYKQMVARGHDCFIVAPTTDKSGNGGRVTFTNSPKLTTDTEFGLVKAGSPSLGQDPLDSHIWYYDGTPAAQIFVALDYVLPTHANFSTPDLILAGPNYGLNLGPFFYTLSGTMGAAYAAIQRGIPAIAYSAAYPTQTSYEWTNTTTAAGLQDPATIAARLAANLAQGLIDKANGSRILPLGYGLSVNIPYITSFKDDSCVNPPFILTRMTGGAVTNKAVYNANTGLVSTQNTEADGLNECINGDCGLVGETVVLDSGCFASVSVFTVDYDAPFSGERLNVTSPYELVPSIVQLRNSTVLVGGLDANGTVTGGSGSSTSTASAATSTLSNSATPTNSAAEVRLPLANFVVLLMISILM